MEQQKFDNLIMLIREISESKLTDFSCECGDMKVRLRKQVGTEYRYADAGQHKTAGIELLTGGAVTAAGAMPTGAVTAAAGTMNTAEEAGNAGQPANPDELLQSPLVGVFYEAPAEDADPFVRAGDTVKKGQVLAIVEAMKLMNEIEAEYDGVITEVLAKNGEAVEYGQPLFRISRR